MASTEGTIQFAYELTPPPESHNWDSATVASLGAWRTLLKRLTLLGQDAERYDGYGYGNLSARPANQPEGFVITASQTSGAEVLEPDHLVEIKGYNLARFWVEAQGHQPPSSETLTHAMVYAADPRINWVFHVHCPELWQQAEALGLPCTAADVSYGSLDMVSAVAELLSSNHSRPLVFATLGHTDGIFALGGNARDTGGLLMVYLAKALEQLGTPAVDPAADDAH